MIFIYNLAIQLYVFVIRLSAVFGNQKAKRWLDGRRNWRETLAKSLKPGEQRIWFHCSSLGEFEQGRPVMEMLKVRHPEFKIVLTFFSPSGYEVRKNYSGADYIFYMPADTKANANDFISLVKPEKVFFTKYEYWHHYFHQLKKKNIPLYMVSAIFRPGDRFFRWYGGFFRDMLKCVTHFFVQEKRSQLLLKEAGFPNSTVAGDTRFDRVTELAKHSKEIPIAMKFSNSKQVLIAGSTWDADEKILAGMLQSFSGRLKLIIAPHEINESRIKEVKDTFKNHKVSLYSSADKDTSGDAEILVIDNMGLLSTLYRYGRYAWVGGGFGKGIHNTLEAAVYGIPVFFGPNYQKFNEAKELLECGGAFTVGNQEALQKLLQNFLVHEEERSRAGAAARNYVQSHAGATGIILSQLEL